MSRCGKVGVAGARAGMSRNTAAKYLGLDRLPSELRVPRTWRTRPDPFESAWPGIVARLREQPGLQAKTLFEQLKLAGSKYEGGQLRTLQRRLKQWRAQEGPEKELFLPQDHRPGEAMQTDFTSMNELGITIAGEPYDHLLCHSVLPYSNWSWGTPCRSESLPALKRGVQATLVRLGRVPEFHQTDNSTAATHRLESGKRAFNEAYLEFMRHYEMTPRTIAVGRKEQNGDIESQHGTLKRDLEQHLLLRGSRDFTDHTQYERWLHGILEVRAQTRGAQFLEELAAMRPLLVAPVPEYTEVLARVGAGGTFRVKGNTYSVPSRLRDERVRARIFDDRVEVFHGETLQITIERLHGKRGHRINYRHVVGSLLRKPGAFRLYRYREDLFPTATFRAAFDALEAALPERQADLEYLRILDLAATTMETEVEAVLRQVLASGGQPRAEDVRARVAPRQASLPALEAVPVDLSCYDHLLEADHCLEVTA